MPTLENNALTKAARGEAFDPATFDANGYSWVRLVQLSGDDAEAWMETFLEGPLPDLISRSNEALFALRKGRIEEGKTALAEVGRELDELDSSGRDLPVTIVRRWQYGTDAYLYYLEKDYDRAYRALDMAEVAIRRSLELEDFLQPLARQCIDFCVQRSRVARNQRRWREVKAHLDEARDMIADRVPLAVLEDGREIYSGTVIDFFRRGRLSEEERAAVDYFFEPDRLKIRFEGVIGSIGVPSGFVIPYH